MGVVLSGRAVTLAALSAPFHAGSFLDGVKTSSGVLQSAAEAGEDVSAQASAVSQIAAAIAAGSIFSANLQNLATFTAGVIAGDAFSFPSEIRMVIASILISARIAATVHPIAPSISSESVELEPVLAGVPSIP